MMWTNQILVFASCFDVEKKIYWKSILPDFIGRPSGCNNIYNEVKADMIVRRINVQFVRCNGWWSCGDKESVLNLFNWGSENEIFRMHCFVHQEVLVGKTVLKFMKNIELTAGNAFNAIKTSSKLSNMIRFTCEINDENHNLLLNYKHVRWPSYDSSVVNQLILLHLFWV